MAPTESSILASYLLAPASLATFLSFEQFRLLFPNAQRLNPQLKLLYRDLQFLRTVDIDVIRENITAECRKGERQKGDVRRALHVKSQNGAVEGVEQIEVEMDIQLFGSNGSLPQRTKGHTMPSMLGEMDKACHELKAEATNAAAEAQTILNHVQEIVGGLSDLRYGKFARVPGVGNEGLEKEVIMRLRALGNTCGSTGNGLLV